MELNFDELRELLTVLNQTNIAELTLKSDDFELTVRSSIPTSHPAISSDGVIGVSAGVITNTVPPAAMTTPIASSGTDFTNSPPVSAPVAVDSKLLEIISPMVGTFYRAPAPDEPPFVSVGDRIQNAQVVCIIEAMKLMNELEAEVSGEVVEILVQNGEPVEYGQILMRVKP
ncbi:MAG: acetyl-CoA carboxylase biotin carboxyl carrier protein [Cyanothece sp. SIO1E1]|nr:acetyl-CoA carboxylase biotin carboxyl carrier protein [Cyanothece sp. SIO1E1]